MESMDHCRSAVYILLGTCTWQLATILLLLVTYFLAASLGFGFWRRAKEGLPGGGAFLLPLSHGTLL